MISVGRISVLPLFLALAGFNNLRAATAYQDETKKAGIAISKKEIALSVSENLFTFMLEHPSLSCKLASGLRITGFRVKKRAEGDIFYRTGFKVTVKNIKGDKNSHTVSFKYAIGIDNPLPVKTTGNGKAVIVSRRDGADGAKADVNIKLYPNNSMLDDISRKVPVILETVFKKMLEKVFRQAEELAEYFMNDSDYLLEIATDEETSLAPSEIEALKRYLKRGEES